MEHERSRHLIRSEDGGAKFGPKVHYVDEKLGCLLNLRMTMTNPPEMRLRRLLGYDVFSLASAKVEVQVSGIYKSVGYWGKNLAEAFLRDFQKRRMG